MARPTGRRAAAAAFLVLRDIGPEANLALGVLTVDARATRLIVEAPSLFSSRQRDRVDGLVDRWNRTARTTRLTVRPNADGSFVVEVEAVVGRPPVTDRLRRPAGPPPPVVPVHEIAIDALRWLLVREAPTHALETAWDRQVVPDLLRLTSLPDE